MPASPIHLLIVEDSPTHTEILQHLLGELGHNLAFATTCVDTAEKALDALRQQPYELVLLDYKLPGADGLSALASIRELPPARQPAVIMLTGMGREDVAVEAMKRGAKDYLSKDTLDVPSLLRAITSALDRKRAEEQIAAYAEELRQRNLQMQIDLNLARELQLAFLPQRYPSFPPTAAPAHSRLRFHHRYFPASTVGGDFFNVLPLSDTAAGVFVCDVMGHGVRAALVTAVLRGLLEQAQRSTATAGAFLAQINRELISVLRQTRTPMFATAFYLVADIARGELHYANAGHPTPLHVRRTAQTIEPLEFPNATPGPALGVFENYSYGTAHHPLAPGDLVLLFTDGLFEVHSAKDELYGQERLLAAVRARLQQPTTELLDNLFTEIQQFAATRSFQDDVCLIGVEAAAP
jgi:sigma-B regulation protein RsbU (phosphoserine phosphatase)